MKFGIIGTSIWQQNMPLLERLTVDREIRAAEIARLKQICSVSMSWSIWPPAIESSSSMRPLPASIAPGKLLHRLIDFFFRSQRDICFFPNDFYHFTGREAILHLFRTAASLESLVVGETQITGQLKQAHQDALEYGVAGTVTSGLINEALHGRQTREARNRSRCRRALDGLAGRVRITGSARECGDSGDRAGRRRPDDPKMAKYVTRTLSRASAVCESHGQQGEALAEEFGGTGCFV